MEVTHSSKISGSLQTMPIVLTTCFFKSNLLTILRPILPSPPHPKLPVILSIQLLNAAFYCMVSGHQNE
jgi:hypothetical protein